jgi:hypothetical protein
VAELPGRNKIRIKIKIKIKIRTIGGSAQGTVKGSGATCAKTTWLPGYLATSVSALKTRVCRDKTRIQLRVVHKLLGYPMSYYRASMARRKQRIAAA